MNNDDDKSTTAMSYLKVEMPASETERKLIPHIISFK